MRNKFTDLINQGVASFNYTQIVPEVPAQCPICRMYNNIWGMCSDTHMSVAADGNTYITGRMVSWKDKWNQFRFDTHWGNVDFTKSGFWCLNDFLFQHKLDAVMTTLNGDVVMQIIPLQDAKITSTPDTIMAKESGIKKSILNITNDYNTDTLSECFKGHLSDVVNNLNENENIKGDKWIASDGNIVGIMNDKIYTIFINEAANKEGFFMGATSRRTQSNFKFNAGEKVILIKYDTDGHNSQLRGVYEIDKVGKNSIKLKGDEYTAAKKFDAYGICIERKKNTYRGNSTLYWVLYNADLADDNDIVQLIEKGTNSWGFHPENRKAATFAAELKEYIDELRK